MDVLEAIKLRRSIRHYKEDPVSDDMVNMVLEAANWAPSWGNTQCWRFIVVRDRETRLRIADGLAKTKFDNEMVDNAAAAGIKQAPVLIVICAEIGSFWAPNFNASFARPSRIPPISNNILPGFTGTTQ